VLRLVLPDGRRIPLAEEVTIGRASANTVQLTGETVSRHHARICARGDAVTIEDAGSSFGTWVDGRRIEAPAPLRDGTKIVLGDLGLLVEDPSDSPEAGHTVVAVPGASRFMPQADAGPRLRSGWALKRLAAGEGEKRWVLKSLRTERFVRLADPDAGLVELLDGHRSTSELVAESERRVGPGGPVRLAQLLTELADRGLLAGVEEPRRAPLGSGRLRRLIAPHELLWPGAGDAIERLSRGGGRHLVGETAVTAFAVI
jgi:pSer/pThr/pTyr-binding forkhead associated (FHA) protein